MGWWFWTLNTQLWGTSDIHSSAWLFWYCVFAMSSLLFKHKKPLWISVCWLRVRGPATEGQFLLRSFSIIKSVQIGFESMLHWDKQTCATHISFETISHGVLVRMGMMGIDLFGSFCNTLQSSFCACWKWVFSADLWGSLIVSGSSCFSHCWSVTMSLDWADYSYVLAFQINVSGNWVWWNAISLGRYYICRGFGCSRTKLTQLSSYFSSWSSLFTRWQLMVTASTFGHFQVETFAHMLSLDLSQGKYLTNHVI
jgi:hypothetical protein